MSFHERYVEFVRKLLRSERQKRKLKPVEVNLVVEHDYPIRTIRQLKQDFYKCHLLTPIQRGKPKIPARPKIIEDPFTQCGDFSGVSSWFAIYTRGYYVKIMCGPSQFKGPHSAQLYFQIREWKFKESYHLGSAQFLCPFFSKVRIRKCLRLALSNRRYFATDATEATEIDFAPPELNAIAEL